MRSFLRPAAARAPSLALLLAALLTPLPAAAVVEQTDGTVVPVLLSPTCAGATDKCVQTALNIGEGFASNALNNPLNAIFDAVTAPEVFGIPKTNGVYGKVTVQDLQEGAGYENTFGWYNVSDPTKLYPITPCADEPVTSRVVDFQIEFGQGRYLGGFIGFFLITPENAPVANNCGATTNVGHIYYTEQARNGDGNYVHYLLYHSKKNPLTYYFGFEDLFRGGDNDFDDMFLGVNGLVAPCVPSPEVCDGKDNNCDGLVDNSPIDAGGACGLSAVGECKLGTLACQGGALVCVGDLGPTQEICDGKDNDCNGMVDDNPVGVGVACGSDVGECQLGAQQCLGGVLVCVGGKGPALELCDGLDNDCDGTVDDGTIDTGGPCGSNIGACTPGVLTCVGGAITCVGGTSGTPEVCDGIDNDCNGLIDDNPSGVGDACGTGVGVCKPGVTHCVGGVITCIGGVGATQETCDGLDNDCNGTVDDGATCPGGAQCIEGTCASPCQSGEFPCPGATVCKNGFCVPATCVGVTCKAGEVCMAGVCVPESDGGVTSSSSSSSSSSGSTSSSSGTGGDGAGGAEPTKQSWGLATGGGGFMCGVGGGDASAFSAGVIAALALCGARRRRTARARRSA